MDAAGFDRTQPAVVSLFGVTPYLTLDATRATLSQLAALAKQSEVTISYAPAPDGTDHVATETFQKASPAVDATGESFLGFYRESDIERLAREAGFTDVTPPSARHAQRPLLRRETRRLAAPFD